MDDLLGRFYRSELPDPWPVMSVPEATPRAPLVPARKRWLRVGARVALAASIGFIVITYLALARNFPRTDVPETGMERGGNIGLKTSPLPKRVTTPKGGEALMWENRPGDRIILDLQMIKGPANGRPNR
jgi:hypothetical protein